MASASRLPSVRRPAASNNGRSRPMSMIDQQNPISSETTSNISTATAAPPTSKLSNRRSLLPQFSSHNTPCDEKAELDGLVEATQKWVNASDSIAEEPGRSAMVELDRRPMPPPASTSRVSRPTSMYGIAASARNPSTVRARGSSNSRVDALAKLTGSGHSIPERSASLSQRVHPTKAPQQASAPRGLARPASILSRGQDAHSRASSTSTVTSGTTTERRPSVALSHGRQPSVATSQSSGKTSPTPRPTSTSPRQATGTNAKAQVLTFARPTFNTFQQHYSPAKSALPKPPLPGVRPSKTMPAPVAVDEALPIDASKLQIELLQLSLLQQASVRSQRDFDASAKRKLGRKHAKLRKDYEMIHASEMEHQRLVNLAAMDAWCPDQALLIESLQILSKVHSELAGLLEPQSRYSDLISTFTVWIEDAESAYTGARAGFAASLPEVWRQTHTSLALKTRALQRELDSLPPPPRERERGVESSLTALLRSCRSLLESMLKELEVMVKLERETVQRERARVDAEVEALTFEPPAKSDWMPAWQSAAS